MTVYVDQACHRYGRMIMCHMVADTHDELHRMADAIGVARRWFQNRGRYHHYDICRSKRTLAVELGAVEVAGKEIIAAARRAQNIGSARQ